MGAFFVVGILSPIATDLEMTSAQAGWVMTAYAVAYLSSPIMVALTGRVERRNLLADRKSTRLNSSHDQISYAVFCLKKKKNNHNKFNENQI